MFGYFTGSLDLLKYLPFMKTQYRALFSIFITACIFLKILLSFEIAISMIFLVVCLSVTLLNTKETVDHRSQSISFSRFLSLFSPYNIIEIRNPFKSIYVGLTNMPPVVSRVCMVQFFSWYNFKLIVSVFGVIGSF